jgi:thymidylate kinase
MKNKFIVIRGASGSGKSTLASALKDINPTNVIVVDQDYFNHVLLKGIADVQSLIPQLIKQTVMTLLGGGYTVILEGVLRKEKYIDVINEIRQQFAGPSEVYYLDVSGEETVKRHASRDKSTLFSAEEMLTWYNLASPLGLEGERVIGEDVDIDTAITMITANIEVPSED